MNVYSLNNVVRGQWFIIKIGGRAYEYIGRAVTGQFVYQDSDLNIYVRKSEFVVYVHPIGKTL